MKKLKIKKIMIVILTAILMLCNFSNFVTAAMPLDEAYLYKVADCGTRLSYFSLKQNRWLNVICYHTEYQMNGARYPAYCLIADYDGVGEAGPYYVDIDTMVDDERIWRIIANGYPYKTPAEMGLGNTEQSVLDAYLVTKRAVHSILYDVYTVSDRYIAYDEHGEFLLTKIQELLDIGRYGTQTRDDDAVFINKEGDVYKEGNYYVQKFNVTSNTELAEYTIIATANLPTGTLITNASGTQTNYYSGGESFFVKVPKASMLTNISAVISARGKCKTYPVFYGKSRIPKTQDYALTYDPYGDLPAGTTFNLDVHKCSLVINKTDEETNQAISGVIYNLKYADGTNIGNYTTDSNGKITATGLHPGKVIATEIETREEYILDTTPIEAELEYNTVKTLNLTNARKRGNLKVYKVDKDNHRITLGNVEFDLYSNEFKRVVGTYTTNVDGEIEISNLRVGSYKLIEKKTSRWYNLAEDTTVQVKWNTTEENTIENELKKGQIKVIKVDKDNNQVKIPNVVFEVKDKNGNVLEKIKTDENGEATTKNYAIRDYDKLFFHETETNQWYSLNDATMEVELQENQITTMTFENEKKKGRIRVIKVDLDDNEIRIPDVEFNVLDEQGNIVDKLKTDENGEAVSERLPIDQKYTLQETKTLENYELNDEMPTVELEENQITNITFENEKKKGQIRVIKVDKDNNEVKLANVKFDVLDENDNILETIVTNEEGEAITCRYPINEKITLREKETLENYVLSEETQTITLEENQIKDIVFENEMVKGKLEITKVDSKTKEILQGAIFGVYDENDNKICQITTNELGIATTDPLVYGKYYVKELDTGSVYYFLNENTYEFEIKTNDELIEITIENDGTDIEVDVEKTGTIEIKPGDKVNYQFSNIANKSNIYLDNFKWFDYIPTDYIRLQNMTTGTWNQDLTYDVYYKTNKSDKYINFKKDLSTKENYFLDFGLIEFAEDEYIVETMFDFGKVETGFRENEKPTMECLSFDTLENGQTFTNKTKTYGTYYEMTAEADDDWTTITHKPEEPEETLPRTGK